MPMHCAQCLCVSVCACESGSCTCAFIASKTSVVVHMCCPSAVATKYTHNQYVKAHECVLSTSQLVSTTSVYGRKMYEGMHATMCTVVCTAHSVIAVTSHFTSTIN
jgi:hypothetical protein